jgi:hypothetical protein
MECYLSDEPIEYNPKRGVLLLTSSYGNRDFRELHRGITGYELQLAVNDGYNYSVCSDRLAKELGVKRVTWCVDGKRKNYASHMGRDPKRKKIISEVLDVPFPSILGSGAVLCTYRGLRGIPENIRILVVGYEKTGDTKEDLLYLGEFPIENIGKIQVTEVPTSQSTDDFGSMLWTIKGMNPDIQIFAEIPEYDRLSLGRLNELGFTVRNVQERNIEFYDRQVEVRTLRMELR